MTIIAYAFIGGLLATPWVFCFGTWAQFGCLVVSLLILSAVSDEAVEKRKKP